METYSVSVEFFHLISQFSTFGVKSLCKLATTHSQLFFIGWVGARTISSNQLRHSGTAAWISGGQGWTSQLHEVMDSTTTKKTNWVHMKSWLRLIHLSVHWQARGKKLSIIMLGNFKLSKRCILFFPLQINSNNLRAGQRAREIVEI